MVSVRIFCCWSILLLALIVQSINDELSNLEPNKTLKGQDNQTESNRSESIFLPSAAVNAKDPRCTLLMNESGITEVIKLVQRSLVNIVDLRFSFSNSFNSRLFADKQIAISIVKPIGEQILNTLDIERYNFVTWSLNVGRRSQNLNVREDPEDCMGDPYDSVVKTTFKRIVLRVQPNPTNYKICYLLQRTIRASRFCCHITVLTNLPKYECPEVESQYGVLYTFLWIFAIVATGLLPIILLILLYAILSRIVFDAKYPEYYKLKESTMSLSFVLFNVIWGEYGDIISYARRLAFIAALSVFSYIIYDEYTNTLNITALLFIIAVNVLISVAVFRMLKNINTERYPLKKKLEDKGFVEGVRFLDQFPFNTKCFQQDERFNLMDKKKFLFTIPNELFRRTSWTILKMVALFVCYLLKVVLLFLLPLPFTLLLAILYLYAVLLQTPYTIMLILEFSFRRDKYSHQSLWRLFFIFCTIVLLTFASFTYYILLFAAQSFLLGLFLNIDYFAPYAAPLAITAFYCCTYWKSVERKYYDLKKSIYKECQQKEINNNTNQHLQPNERILSVVNKNLYENCRSELLPYGKKLLQLGFKFVILFLYLWGAFMIVGIFHEYNVAVQTLTTLTVSVLPYIANMLALKVTREGKETWSDLELKLKHMVHKQTDGTCSVLAQTFLVVTEGSAGIMRGKGFSIHFDLAETVSLIEKGGKDKVDRPTIVTEYAMNDTVDANVSASTSGVSPHISKTTTDIRMELSQIPPKKNANNQNATNVNTASIDIKYESSV